MGINGAMRRMKEVEGLMDVFQEAHRLRRVEHEDE
jgi:hypothetical protein